MPLSVHLINYERMVSESNCLRIGLLLIPFSSHAIFTGTTSFSTLIGKKQHKLELGGGVSLVALTDVAASGVIVAGIVGYRYQPLNGGFLFRVTFTPFIASNGYGLPWGGISFGWNF